MCMSTVYANVSSLENVHKHNIIGHIIMRIICLKETCNIVRKPWWPIYHVYVGYISIGNIKVHDTEDK